MPYGANSGRYTSGLLFSNGGYGLPGNYQFSYGRFELRCRFPIGTDGWLGKPLWPAFWLIGGECGTEEIDIFELNDTQASDHNRIFTTLHGVAGGLLTNNVRCDNCIGKTPNSTRINDGYGWVVDGNYHTFAVEWEPACITWLVDGIEIKRHYRFYDSSGRTLGQTVPAGTNFQHPMWPFHPLSIVIGMGMGNETPDGSINFLGPDHAASLDVDYVRVYQRLPVSDPKNLCSGTITGEKVVCNGDNYTADFRLPTTQINWTCSSNLTLSNLTGNTVTVTPASSGLSEQGWIRAEPVFQNGALCTTADAIVTKQVWIGLPATYSNFFASIATSSTCSDFSACVNLPGAPLMGATYAWSYTPPAGHRDASAPADSVKGQAKQSAPGPIGPTNPGGCVGCPSTSSSQCIQGAWADYPGASARVTYVIAVSNRCGTVTVSGDIFRPYSTSNPCPTTTTPPTQPKEQPSKLNFYPNPTNASLSVSATEGYAGQLYLCNAYGKVVLTTKLESQELKIDTSKLSEGVYILKFVGADFTTVERVFINHQ